MTTTTAKNECAKTRPVENPYEVWIAGDWEWRVLKKYQTPEKEASNQYARWFCAVRSPMTYGSFDMGDTYVRDVKQYARKLPAEQLAPFLLANPVEQ